MVLQGFLLANIFVGVCSILYLIQGKREKLLQLFAVSLAFTGVVTFFGTVWNPPKIVGLCCLIHLISSFSANFLYRSSVALIVVSIFCSTFLGQFLIPDLWGDSEFSLQSASLRPYVQCGFYITAFSIFAMLANQKRTACDNQRVFDSLLLASFVSIAGAILQLVFISVGIPFLPIPRYNGIQSEMAAFAMNGNVVQRLYGFSGEPKYLGSFLIPCLFVQVFASIDPVISSTRKFLLRCLVLLTFLILVLTFSTSVFVALFASLVPVFFGGLSNRNHRLAAVSVCVTVVLVTAVAFVLVPDYANSTAQYVYLRFYDRLSNEGMQTTEIKAIDYVVNMNPQYVFFGLGPGMYNYHGLSAISVAQGAEPISSCWIAFFVDCGLAGALLMTVFLMSLIFRSTKVSSVYLDSKHSVYLAGLVGSIIIGFTAGSFWTVMFFAGLVAANRSSFTAEDAVRAISLGDRSKSLVR